MPTSSTPSIAARPLARAVAPWLLVFAFLAGCNREAAPGGQAATSGPAATVTTLATQLQGGDLDGYARTAVPPALHAELEAAWRQDRSRWPLSELPMAGKLPPLLAAFGAEGAEATLQGAFDRQFAGEDQELDAAAQSLSLWGVEYVSNEGEFTTPRSSKPSAPGPPARRSPTGPVPGHPSSASPRPPAPPAWTNRRTSPRWA